MAEVLLAYLTDDHDVALATTLGGAMGSLARRRPDVILLDPTLPDSDGFDTVRRVVEAAPGVPVLVPTGHQDPLLAITAVRSGAHDFLVKAFVERDPLREAITGAIETRRAACPTTHPPPRVVTG